MSETQDNDACDEFTNMHKTRLSDVSDGGCMFRLAHDHNYYCNTEKEALEVQSSALMGGVLQGRLTKLDKAKTLF